VRKLLFILFLGSFIAGCAITVPITKEEPYSFIHFENSLTILVAQLKDTRSNKRDIGGVGLGYFVVDVDIPAEIHNKILKQLAEQKFNIKVLPSETISDLIETEKIKDVIRENSANAMFLAELEQFEIPRGADATFQTTDLVSRLFVSFFDSDGIKIYQNKIMFTAKRYFGLATIGPAKDLVEDSMGGIVDKLFDDHEFIKALESIR